MKSQRNGGPNKKNSVLFGRREISVAYNNASMPPEKQEKDLREAN